MSTSNSHHTISKEAMVTGFPAKIPSVEGEICVKELLRIFLHLVKCAQSTPTAYHELNFLFLVVPEQIWCVYSSGTYPTTPTQPSTNPPYVNTTNGLQNQVIKDDWSVAKKYYEEDQNMNKALTERFLALIPNEYSMEYAEVLTRDPNRKFVATFVHFYSEFGQEDEVEIEANKDEMKAPWHPREGFQVLKRRVTDGMLFASFAGKPISNEDALNMVMVVITRTRMFPAAYQEWHSRPANQKTIYDAFTFWKEKVRIMKKYDKVAGSMGRGEEYGMAAGPTSDETNDSDEVIEDYALSMQLSTQNAMLQQ